jgi:arylsulfatase A-like enzyme
MAEDMSARVGAFGDPVAKTPNLDQLAAEGMRFTQVFTSAGVCAPSRAAVITGMHQMSFGGQHMRTSAITGGYKTVPPPTVKAFPELLRAAGYFTLTDTKLDYQFSGVSEHSGPFTIWDAEGTESDWRQRAKDQPFFAYLNFDVTHESGILPELGRWPNNIVHFASQLIRYWRGHRVINGPVAPQEVRLEPYYPDNTIVRADIARHYNNIFQMDAQLGRLLARLESEGLADDTIVIWTTDHGDGLPRAKRELYDSGLHVPMIIRWPEKYRPDDVVPGTMDTRLLSFVDLAPTILALAGIEKPPFMHGRAFIQRNNQQWTMTEAKRNYIFAARDRIDQIPDRRRAVRSSRYKYIRNWHPDLPTGHALGFRDNLNMVREMRRLFEAGELDDIQAQWFQATGKEQLFDLKNDPHEISNLAENPNYQAQLEKMRSALDRWLSETVDLSEQSEDEMIASFLVNGKPGETPQPSAKVIDGYVHLSNAEQAASMGYKINDGHWKLYVSPFPISPGDTVEAKAVRYGWEESAVTKIQGGV